MTTPSARVECERVVVAVDGGLERVMPELAGRVRTARAQMLATAPTTEVRLRCPVYARWGLDYWQQLPDGRVALGGCRDRGGDAEWTLDATPSDAVQHELDGLLRDRLQVSAAVTHRWAGLIAFTPDKLPVLEEVRPGVVAAGAYSGTGNVVGAICGRAAVARARRALPRGRPARRRWGALMAGYSGTPLPKKLGIKPGVAASCSWARPTASTTRWARCPTA